MGVRVRVGGGRGGGGGGGGEEEGMEGVQHDDSGACNRQHGGIYEGG